MDSGHSIIKMQQEMEGKVPDCQPDEDTLTAVIDNATQQPPSDTTLPLKEDIVTKMEEEIVPVGEVHNILPEEQSIAIDDTENGGVLTKYLCFVNK